MTYHYIPDGLSLGDFQIPPVGSANDEPFQVYNRVGVDASEGDILMLDLYGAASETTVFTEWNQDGTSGWRNAVLPTLVHLQRSLPVLVVVEGGADNELITVKRACGYIDRVLVGTSDATSGSPTTSAVAGDSVYMRNTKRYLDIHDATTCIEVGVLLEDTSTFSSNNETEFLSVMFLYPSYQRTVS